MHLPNSVHTFPRDCFYKAHHITFLVPYETTENPSPYHHLLSLSFVSHSFSLPFALCAIITLALLLLLKHPKLILCHFTRALSSAWSSLVSDPPWLTLSQYQSLFLYHSSRKESFQCTLLKNSTYDLQIINGYCFKSLSLWYLSHSNRKLISPPLLIIDSQPRIIRNMRKA